ncbi:hypothetical protein [Sphingobacterium multivorum]|uniref:hypothetical protein n=1 Tax=Sphingobacterium multivorum TaxID=28454 RepID=UPI0031BACDE4
MKLSERGYIFGLGAFRRYKEITGHDIEHFEQALLPEFIVDEKGEPVLDEDGLKIPFRQIDLMESSYRWAIMLKAANDLHCNINGGDKLSVDEFTILLDNADQEESNKLMDQYLDSNYLGKKMRVYYGIPEPTKEAPKAKKKASPRVKPQS